MSDTSPPSSLSPHRKVQFLDWHTTNLSPADFNDPNLKYMGEDYMEYEILQSPNGVGDLSIIASPASQIQRASAADRDEYEEPNTDTKEEADAAQPEAQNNPTRTDFFKKAACSFDLASQCKADLGVMDQILDVSKKLQSELYDTLRSTPRAAPEHRFRPELKQINDSVYSVHSPSEGERPSVEIVFFHGLQLQESHDTLIASWVSRDPWNPELWLTWILEDCPDARILLISYDAHVRKTNDEGRMDMYCTGENIIRDLIFNAEVGHDGCPVVLVGHCLGGLLMKELCVQAQKRVAVRKQDKINNALQNFLVNVQGFFFYASPHHGTRLADSSTFSKGGPLFQLVTTLNPEAARGNEDFRTLRQKYGWKTFGVGETLPVNLGYYNDLVVEEASSRHDVDEFYTEATNHFDICRPKSRKCSNFRRLRAFVSEVVKNDEFRQGPTLRIPEYVVGLEPQVNKIRDIVIGDGNIGKETRRLGILGIGGIGKTTLAKAVFNAISGYFDYTCFLEEVKKIDPESLRAKMRENLSVRGRKVNETFEWGHLKRKRVLIVLDDVNSASQIQVITENDLFSSHSEDAVIVTARDRGFLIPEDFECHFVGKLEYQESKMVFCKHAFKNATVCDEPLVDSFLEKCDGLPLALEVAGRYLYKRPEEVWVDALKKLGLHPLNGDREERLTSILNMSYENLAPIEQEMFLDVAQCFHGLTWSTVKRTWEKYGCEGLVSGWQNLLDKALVTKVFAPRWWDAEGDSRYVIQMHELLRDLGRSKVLTNPDIVSGPSLRNQGNPLILKVGFNDIRLDIFQEADVLYPDIGRSSGVGHSVPNRHLFLKTKHLHRWISQQLATRQTLRSLEIEECLYFVSLPSLLGKLLGLEHLKIANCSNLEDLPESLGQLKSLQQLTIQGCCNLEALPVSLGELKSLRQLTIQECGNLGALPESLRKLCALKILTVAECQSLEALPESIHLLPSLEQLIIEGCHNLEALPSQLGELAVLKTLKISDCYSLHTLPGSICRLPALQTLTLQQCHSLEALPKSLGHLLTLEHLTLKGCYSLQTLPESLRQLPGRRHLTIMCSPGLKALPFTFGLLQDPKDEMIQGFYSLEHFPFLLRYYPFQHVPEFVVNLQDLEHLTIEGSKLPEISEDLHAVKRVTIYGLGNFEHLPESLGQLENLKQLTIQGCSYIKNLPESLGDLRALQQLIIVACPRLERLPESLGRLETLKHLTIKGCSNIEDLKSLGNLRALTIEHCSSLQDLPKDMKNLRALRIAYCHRLQYIPESLGQLETLESLYIKKCSNLQDLPKNMKNLRALKHLCIADCPRLKHIPKSFGQLETLEILTIVNCSNLQYLERLTIEGSQLRQDLPEMSGDRQAVKRVTIYGRGNLEHLQESLGRLETSKMLTIQGCSNIEILPESLGDLRALQQLIIEECPRLERLPESLGRLETLKDLRIRGCSSIENLPESLGDLRALQQLTLAECLRLERLPESLGRLETLKDLTILRCRNIEILPESLGDL